MTDHDREREAAEQIWRGPFVKFEGDQIEAIAKIIRRVVSEPLEQEIDRVEKSMAFNEAGVQFLQKENERLRKLVDICGILIEAMRQEKETLK